MKTEIKYKGVYLQAFFNISYNENNKQSMEHIHNVMCSASHKL